MTRPKGVEITTWLMGLSLLVGIAFSAAHWNSIADIHLKPGSKNTVETVRMARNIFEVVATAISIVVVFFYSKGRDSARVLVLIGCAGCLLALRGLPSYWHASHFFYVLDVLLNALFAVYLLWYLFQPDVRAWFNEQTLQAYRARHPLPAQ